MTDINKTKNRRIETPEDAQALFQPLPPGAGGKIGLEVEMNLYKTHAGHIAIPPASAMQQMQKDLKDLGFDAQLEAAGVLEYASPAVDIADVSLLMKTVAKDLSAFTHVARKEGYTRSPFSVLPTATKEQAMKNLVSRERLQAALAAIPGIYGDEALKIPLLTTGVQASFSPETADEMFRMARRAYMLTPLLLASMNSNAGFIDNNPQPYKSHARATFYQAHRRAGGLADSFKKAHDGASYIREHVEMVFDIPMFFAYDLDGNILPPEKDGPHTFRQLAALGLNTQSNFELAESFLYHDVKICNLRDAEGETIGKRLEVRAADSGPHQPDHVLLLTAALVPDGPTAAAFESLWKNYGFTGHPPTDAELLELSRDGAVNHDGRFMDVPFGTGRMRDFANDVAKLLADHYRHDTSVVVQLDRLCGLLRTGACDAARHATHLKSLPQVVNYLSRKAEMPARGKHMKRAI